MDLFRWYVALLWIFAQFLGAIVAGGLLRAVFGGNNTLGRPMVGPGFSVGNAFAYEIIGSSIFLLVVLTVTLHPKLRPWTVILAGLTYVFLVMVGSLISGSALNWWQHFGPTVVANSWDGAKLFCPAGAICPIPTPFVENDGASGTNADWIWYVGPFLGALIAIVLFWAFFYWWLARSDEYMAMVSSYEREETPKGPRTRVNSSREKRKSNVPELGTQIFT